MTEAQMELRVERIKIMQAEPDVTPDDIERVLAAFPDLYGESW